MSVISKKKYVRDAEQFLARSLFRRTYRVKKADRKRVLGGLWLKLLVDWGGEVVLTVPWRLVGPRAQVGELLWLFSEDGEAWERPQFFEEEDPEWPEFFAQTQEARDEFARLDGNCNWEEYARKYRRHENVWQNGPLRPGLWLRENDESFRAEAERLLDLRK